jgi:hypothetical protein
MVERIAEAVSAPSRSPRQYMPPFTCTYKRDASLAAGIEPSPVSPGCWFMGSASPSQRCSGITQIGWF